MSEKYVSASKLKAHYSWLGKDATLSPKDVDDIVDAQPAADVEPVVRGEWKPDDRMFGVWHCSVCGESALCNGVDEEVKSAFCPHCGAKMNLN